MSLLPEPPGEELPGRCLPLTPPLAQGPGRLLLHRLLLAGGEAGGPTGARGPAGETGGRCGDALADGEPRVPPYDAAADGCGRPQRRLPLRRVSGRDERCGRHCWDVCDGDRGRGPAEDTGGEGGAGTTGGGGRPTAHFGGAAVFRAPDSADGRGKWEGPYPAPPCGQWAMRVDHMT